MDSLRIQAALGEFGGLDGAVLLSMAFENRQTAEHPTRCRLDFEAYENASGTWKRLRIEAVGAVIFSWTEIFWKSYLVLSYPVEVLSWQGKIVIDFDPLGAKLREGAVSLSEYYLGGESIIISENCE